MNAGIHGVPITHRRLQRRWVRAERAPDHEAGLADLVNARHRISPSVEIEPAYGHTMWQSILHLTSQEKEVYFTSDVFHHPLPMLYPELHMPACDDLERAIETRRRVAAMCADRNALVIPAHFSTTHAGICATRNRAVSSNPSLNNEDIGLQGELS
jgi:glyoxylase-like metal-dependent hydrolase (beta-lactamase superfamily II)